MTSVLEQLKDMTTVVADTGDIAAVAKYQPRDCTTNPSLVLKAFSDPNSAELLQSEVDVGRKTNLSAEAIAAQLTVALGVELTKLLPGRVSTEVDACLSFNIQSSIDRAREIVANYASRGVERERILIKLASTWEGIRAAEILQKEGIDCNLTLLFSLAQAIACADAKVFLISPFVGRITDWYKTADQVAGYEPDDDPGVKSVRTIYDYYKSNDIKTVVMGASFRNVGQIKALAGCDNLTISPDLLDALSMEDAELPRALSPETATKAMPVRMNEAKFRWQLNSDPMATEKLAQGIRSFDLDHKKLINHVVRKLDAA